MNNHNMKEQRLSMNLKLIYIIFLAPCPLKGNVSSFECRTVKSPLGDLGANVKILNDTN
jgi:hypothetical protein